MTDPVLYVTVAVASLAGLAMSLAAALRGWHGWLELKQLELKHERVEPTMPSTAGSRIEIADLKERIRKLEAIAAGVDL